jgi:hypothetical protein
MTKRLTFLAACATIFAALCAASGDGDRAPLLPQLSSSPLQVVSTVPANGDVNPYGVTFVPHDFASGGSIHPGDVLVSNFNGSGNLQGTGTTIVSISPGGTQSDGMSDTVGQGSLIAIDRYGKQIASFTDSTFLDGPWDLTLIDLGSKAIVFVSNVLNGSVSRLTFEISQNGEHVLLQSAVQIAEGYLFRPDPNALVVGPTGLAFDCSHGNLFVASTGDNAIYSIKDALARWKPVNKGDLVYQDSAHLRGPLGLILAPNGHLITTNGDAVNGNPAQPSEMVEFTQSGHFVALYSVDLGGQGGAFGLALQTEGDKLRLAAVDDVVNTLEIWTLWN